MVVSLWRPHCLLIPPVMVFRQCSLPWSAVLYKAPHSSTHNLLISLHGLAGFRANALNTTMQSIFSFILLLFASRVYLRSMAYNFLDSSDVEDCNQLNSRHLIPPYMAAAKANKKKHQSPSLFSVSLLDHCKNMAVQHCREENQLHL